MHAVLINKTRTKERKMNDIGISSKLDTDRIEHLFKIGIFAALMVLAGDMLLGYGVSEPGTTGLEANFSRYMSVPDLRIFWSATLGLIGIPTECLCYFGVYRLMAERSDKHAHAYRAGIFGALILGALVHVVCCAAAYFCKAVRALSPDTAMDGTMRFMGYFLLPATVIFMIFFGILIGVQISAFAKEKTPLPKWCWVFTPLFGVLSTLIMKLSGDHALTNAIATGWISVGNLWTFGGLLIMSRKHLHDTGENT